MNVHTYYPVDPVLKKHIEYYYFLKTDGDDFLSSYYAFPNPLQSFNIHRHATCQINANSISVAGHTEDNPLIIVQGQHQTPLLVQLQGKLDKITILFKPLGLNHFIQSSLGLVASQPSQVFSEWEKEKGYETFLAAFFNTGDNAERVAVLEDYLLLLYRPLRKEAVLQQAVALLTDFCEERPVEEIAKIIGLNTRSFNRLFAKHLGISPVGFRKIARFRHSLKNALFHDRFRTLTKVAYESNYYDQSYFHKMYKKLTGQNPMKFFDSVDKLADNRLIFQFVRK